MNVLVVSNMGSKPSNPSLGLFVDNQVAALRRILDNVCYFKMTYNGDGFTHKLLKYPVFFFKFFLTHILSKTKYDIIHIHYYYPCNSGVPKHRIALSLSHAHSLFF